MDSTAGSSVRTAILYSLVAGLSLLPLAACDGGDAAGPPEGPSSIAPLVSSNLSAEVGSTLDAEPRVVAKDSRGQPVAGVRVLFRVAEGGGTIQRDFAITDVSGRAGPGQWTLGVRPGRQVIEATTSGAGGVQIVATALPGRPAALAVVAGSGQSASPSTPVAKSPAVRVTDAFGNASPGTVVEFSVVAGGGTIERTSAVAGGDGIAEAGTWMLGPAAGLNVVRAEIGGVVAEIEALAVEPSANGIVALDGDGQSGEVGTTLATAPAVLTVDPFGFPEPGVAVRFSVGAGRGIVTADGQADSVVSVTSDWDGIASLDGWTLGTTTGTQVLVASVGPDVTATFIATATAGAPAVLAAIAGDGQYGSAGQYLDVQPAVEVADQYGNVVADAAVTFEVASGGGSVSPATVMTDVAGVARVLWKLGPIPGQNVLNARTGGVSTSITATGTAANEAPDGFGITLRFLSTFTALQRTAIENAAARWSSVITGDLPNLAVQVADGACTPAMSEVVDDVVIFVKAEPIDGPGSTLASAGPCYIRSSGGLPVVGRMTFDQADLASMESTGALAHVTLHEMGHVLGLGIDWMDRLVGDGGPDPYFTGSYAFEEYVALGGPGPGVPVEATGGSGTAYSHWRETAFDNEVMTGWINFGRANPLSRVTAGLLRDLGYEVDLSRTDAYELPAGGIGGHAAALGEERFELIEAPLPPPLRIGPDGRPIG
jgi:hypothetical protein